MFHPAYAGEHLWQKGDVYLDRVVKDEPCRVCDESAEFVVILDRAEPARQAEYPLCAGHSGVE